MTRPLGERPLKRFVGMLAGRYIYRATEDDPGQLVDFTYVEGVPTVTIADGEDAGEELDEREMYPRSFLRPGTR